MRSTNRKATFALAAASSFVGIYGLTAGSASGANATWNSTAATSFWNNSADWLSGGASYLPVNNDLLFFGAAATTNLNNDFVGRTFNGITFNSGAAAFTLNGNAIVIGNPSPAGATGVGTLINSSNTRQTINADVILTPGDHLIQGSITFGGALTHNPGGVATFTTGTGSVQTSVTSSLANTNGILGGWAVVGGDWATLSSNSIIALSCGELHQRRRRRDYQ